MPEFLYIEFDIVREETLFKVFIFEFGLILTIVAIMIALFPLILESPLKVKDFPLVLILYLSNLRFSMDPSE